ncbi:cullin-1-like [Zingiber officinale]|uniref:cullin-1-like n=1 Tax=Zingiber officinale TaxID=94328 RepID=UPI001C4C5366|nr:cullin-1-like [Zingiber officinale]
MAMMWRRKQTPFDEGWKFVEEGITKLKMILKEGLSLPESPITSTEFILLHTSIYNMCSQWNDYNQEELLYNKYTEVFEEYTTSVVLPSLEEKYNEFMLRELTKQWLNHKYMTKWLSHIFGYLSRFFIKQRSLPSLNEIALSCFRNQVYQVIKGKVKDAVISLIDQEREGEQIDRALLKNVIDIFVEIGSEKMDYYENDFEVEMLKDTKTYYSRKASNLIQVESCSNYMLKVEEFFKREKDRVAHYLHASSELKLLEKVQDEVLVVHSRQLLEKEDSICYFLLQEDRVDDLSRMYRLFSKIPNGLDLISKIYQKHVIAEGTTLVKQVGAAASNKIIFGKKIIELHDRYMAFVNDCFQNQRLFCKALEKAFETFCNVSSTIELLAIYCDDILKKNGNEKLNDDEIEETLEKVTKLLFYINDKVLFAEYCRRKLAWRLLSDKGANEEHEKSFLSKLKRQNGAFFTSKMDRMVKDQTLSRQIQAEFEEYLQTYPQANPGLDLTVTILTSASWPHYRSSHLKVPSEMVRCIQVFEGFYQPEKTRRKLSWIYSLGTCTMNVIFDDKPVELFMTTYQAAVLLLFKDSERLNCTDIISQLNLTKDEVVRLLRSLSCSSCKILNKEPNSNSISSEDVFEFNSKFIDRRKRINICLPPPADEKKIFEHVDRDRIYAIDASLVRIMKFREVLHYRRLIAECVQQLSSIFKPNSSLIKRRIEDLMQRGYLERDSKDPNFFKYLPE